jgi:hypothetical protein
MMTSANASFPRLFTEIDELSRPDHNHLTVEDKCFFLGEYASRMGWKHSATNNLIQNFKKPMNRRDTDQWRYKSINISKAAEAMRAALANSMSGVTFVPVPPSKIKGDPDYDDRMLQMLRQIGPNIDIREIVTQTQNRDAAHGSEDRRDPDNVVALYAIDEALCNPEPNIILICDDLMVTGCQYRAMRTKLGLRFPSAQFFGVFLARRVPQKVDTDLLFGQVEEE